MKHDIFEFNAEGMTWFDHAWRAILLVALLTILACDIFIWRVQ